MFIPVQPFPRAVRRGKPPIPTTYDELVEHYDPLVRWVIGRTARLARQQRRLSLEDAEDLRQHVYEVMLRRNYLARCRAYLATHDTSMTSSLYTFVQRVSMNWFRDQGVRRGYERKATRDVKMVHTHEQLQRQESAPDFDIQDPHDVAKQIEAGIMLDELSERLPADTRQIFDACRLDGEISGGVIAARLPAHRPRTALRALRRDLKETYAAAGL